MNKFIELTLKDGGKILINIEAIESVMLYSNQTCINMRGDTDNYHLVQESYEEVKRLCQSEK